MELARGIESSTCGLQIFSRNCASKTYPHRKTKILRTHEGHGLSWAGLFWSQRGRRIHEKFQEILRLISKNGPLINGTTRCEFRGDSREDTGRLARDLPSCKRTFPMRFTDQLLRKEAERGSGRIAPHPERRSVASMLASGDGRLRRSLTGRERGI